jgi:hypothetical protein
LGHTSQNQEPLQILDQYFASYLKELNTLDQMLVALLQEVLDLQEVLVQQEVLDLQEVGSTIELAPLQEVLD